jgi:hypothetical protein
MRWLGKASLRKGLEFSTMVFGRAPLGGPSGGPHPEPVEGRGPSPQTPRSSWPGLTRPSSTPRRIIGGKAGWIPGSSPGMTVVGAPIWAPSPLPIPASFPRQWPTARPIPASFPRKRESILAGKTIRHIASARSRSIRPPPPDPSGSKPSARSAPFEPGSHGLLAQKAIHRIDFPPGGGQLEASGATRMPLLGKPARENTREHWRGAAS